MSILIKDGKIPSKCYDCQFLEGDGFDGLCHAANKWLDDDFFRWYQYDEGDIDDSKPVNCPLVEIPPHGRLIDADAFSTKIIEIIKAQDYDNFYAHSLSVGEILREVVNELKGTGMDGFNNAPTIIEGESE